MLFRLFGFLIVSVSLIAIIGPKPSSADEASELVESGRRLVLSTNPSDHSRGAQQFQAASRLGNAEAMFELGNCYLTGRGVNKDEVSAFECFRRSAKSGNKRAMWMLGNLYQSG